MTDPEQQPTTDERPRWRRLLWPALLMLVVVLTAVKGCTSILHEHDAPEIVPGGKASSGADASSIRTHDQASFTQGLTVHEGHLVETTGIVGKSRIIVDPGHDGPQPQVVALPADVFGEGSAIVGEELLVLTWKNHKVLRYSWPALDLLGELPYDREGWGMCADVDGKGVWTSDGTDELVLRDPRTMTPVRSVKVSLRGEPVNNINELDCSRDGMVRANVWKTPFIITVDPADGRLVATSQMGDLIADADYRAERSGELLGSNDVLNGIAETEVDGVFYVTGKGWPVTYRTRLPEVATGE